MNTDSLNKIAFSQCFENTEDFYNAYVKLNDEFFKSTNNQTLKDLKNLSNLYFFKNFGDVNLNVYFQKLKKSEELKSYLFKKIISFLERGIDSIFSEIDILKMYMYNPSLFQFYINFFKEDIVNCIKLKNVLNFSNFLQLFSINLFQDVRNVYNDLNYKNEKDIFLLLSTIKDLKTENKELNLRIKRLEREIL